MLSFSVDAHGSLEPEDDHAPRAVALKAIKPSIS